MDEKIKILAFHLPQFHAIPENDEWWGKGFTEWVNVKKAKSLYPGHQQPRVPLRGDYYDLSCRSAIRKQMDMAREYGVYGFCYYHYWFDGKLLLEKPLELMRTMEDRLPYCFCWANEPWARTWDGQANHILMPQYYGGEQEWEKHFLYLLDFFRDEAYIKKDGMPLLVLYRTNDIPDCQKMIEYFNTRCVESGFAGIYLVEERNSFQKQPCCPNADAILDFEPMYTLKQARGRFRRAWDKAVKVCFNLFTGNRLLVYSYDAVWKNMLRRRYPQDGKTYYRGGFVDWDNTPRKGKNGLVIRGANPKKFQRYLTRQVKNAAQAGTEFLFLNAWNEWGEGTYLEPDEHCGYGYLEAISHITQC